MCQCAPTDILDEIEVTERNKDKFLGSVSETKDDRKHGYLIECDLQYRPK